MGGRGAGRGRGRGRGGGGGRSTRGRSGRGGYRSDDSDERALQGSLGYASLFQRKPKAKGKRRQSSDDEGTPDGPGTVRTSLNIGGIRIYEDRGRGAVDLPVGSDDSDSDSSGSSLSDSGSGSSWEEDAAFADDLDETAMADYAANVGLSGDSAGAAAARAAIAAMVLGGENSRGGARHARVQFESSDEEEEEEEEEEEGMIGAGSAPAAGWQWSNGGRVMRRGEPGGAAAPGAAPGSKGKGRKGSRVVPGEKARLRKEGIKEKRAARATSRGFDARAVCEALGAFVAAGGDMMALKPAGKFELKVTAGIAALHGLRCSVQGSGKKRFAVVNSTRNACVPDGDDPALRELLRVGVGGCDVLEVAPEGSRGKKRSSGEPRRREDKGRTPPWQGSGGKMARSEPRPQRSKSVSFVAGGRIGGDGEEVEYAEAEAQPIAPDADAPPAPSPVVLATPVPLNRGLRRAAEAAQREAERLARRRGGGRRERRPDEHLSRSVGAVTHGDFGDFERHTTGFGSRMLEKMGFAGVGAGLGARGEGRAEPIIAVQRPKGVGIGAE